MSLNLNDLLRALYGVKTTEYTNRTASSVTTTCGCILKHDPKRLSFVVSVTGASPIYIAPHPGVTTDNGIYIAGNGGNAVFQWDKDFSVVGRAWYATSANPNVAVSILEIVSV